MPLGWCTRCGGRTANDWEEYEVSCLNCGGVSQRCRRCGSGILVITLADERCERCGYVSAFPPGHQQPQWRGQRQRKLSELPREDDGF